MSEADGKSGGWVIRWLAIDCQRVILEGKGVSRM